MLHILEPAQLLSRRTLAVAAILLLHVTVAYYLAVGLIKSATPPDDFRTTAIVLLEPWPQPPTPPAPRTTPVHTPHLATPQPQPIPPVPVEVPVEQPADSTSLTPQPPVPDAGVPTELRMFGQNVLPSSEDYYPPGKRREGIQGAPVVRVCVDPRGVRSGEPVLEQSSGDAELDRGALNVARHGRYARAEQGGVPVANCYRFRITFRIS